MSELTQEPAAEEPQAPFEEGPTVIPDATADPDAVGDAFVEADPEAAISENHGADPIRVNPHLEPPESVVQETTEQYETEALPGTTYVPESGEQSESALGTFTAIAITGDVIEMKDKELHGDITVLVDTSNNKWAICPEDPQCVEPFNAEKHLSTASSASVGDAEAHDHPGLAGKDATEQAQAEVDLDEA